MLNSVVNDDVVQSCLTAVKLSSLSRHHLISIQLLHVSMHFAISSLLLSLSWMFSDFFCWGLVEAWMSNIIWQHWCLSASWQKRKGRRWRRGWAAKIQLAKNASVNQRQEMNSKHAQHQSSQITSIINITEQNRSRHLYNQYQWELKSI